MGSFLIRTALTGVAVWIASLIVPGIDIVGYDNGWQKAGIIFAVALIFGIVNAVIKPIVQIIAIPLYVLTVGLIHVVINAFMLEITAWITDHTTHWGLHVNNFFWAAIFGALVISFVSWTLTILTSKE